VKLLLTSYKFYDAIMEQVSADLADWLHDHEKRWKTQVRWDLPDDDGFRAEELVGALSALAEAAETTAKRGKAIDRLVGEIRAVYPATEAPATEPDLGEQIEAILGGTDDDQAVLQDMLAQAPAGAPTEIVESALRDLVTEGQIQVVQTTADDQVASQEPVEAHQDPEEVVEAPEVKPVEKAPQKAPQAVELSKPEPVAPAAPPVQKRAAYLLADLFRNLKVDEA